MFAKALALFVTLLVSGCADARPKDWALRLEFDEGVCSGTAVGVDLILTAEHCWTAGRLRKINGHPANALEIVKDGQDHVLARVTVTFRRWARMGPQAVQGDRLSWIGHPAGLSWQYREGYVTGTHKGHLLIDSQAFGGDSGAGLHDARGRVVGVLMGAWRWEQPVRDVRFDMQLVVALPLAFTSEHWREIRA